MKNITLICTIGCVALMSGCNSTPPTVQKKVNTLGIKDVALYLDDATIKEINGDFDKLYDLWITPNFKDMYGRSRNSHYTGRAGSVYKKVNSQAYLKGFSDFCKAQGFVLENSSTTIREEVADVYTCVDNNNVELSQIQISNNWHVFNTKMHLKKEEVIEELEGKRQEHFKKYSNYNGPTGELYFKDGSKYEFIRIGDLNSKKDIAISIRDTQKFLTPVKELYLDEISSFSIDSDSLATKITYRNGSTYTNKNTHNHAVFEFDDEYQQHWFEQKFVVRDPTNLDLFTLLNSDNSIEKVVIDDPKVWKNMKLERLPLGNGNVFRQASIRSHLQKIEEIKSELSEKGQSHYIPKAGDTINDYLVSSVMSSLRYMSNDCNGYEHNKGVDKSKLTNIQDCYQAKKEFSLLNKGYPLGINETPLAYYALLSTIKKDLL